MQTGLQYKQLHPELCLHPLTIQLLVGQGILKQCRDEAEWLLKCNSTYI